jgi:RNA polymerase sigma-B factor
VTRRGATPPQGRTSAGAAPTPPTSDLVDDLSGNLVDDLSDDHQEHVAPHGHAAEIDAMLRRLAAMPADDPQRVPLRQHLVEAQLPLVHHLAQRFRGRGEPYDDLVQVGTIGLLNAVDRFDPERGSFTGFAVPTILGEIRRHFRDRGWALRVPRRLQELGRQVSEAREILTQQLGRSPTVQEIAQQLDADPDLVLEALDTASVYATVPLPSTPEEGEMAPLGFIDSGLELVEQRATLRPLLARLPARERTILALRFVRGMSQSQIAAEVGVSQMHVSRLITRSLAVLRDGLSEEV